MKLYYKATILYLLNKLQYKFNNTFNANGANYNAIIVQKLTALAM